MFITSISTLAIRPDRPKEGDIYAKTRSNETKQDKAL